MNFKRLVFLDLADRTAQAFDVLRIGEQGPPQIRDDCEKIAAASNEVTSIVGHISRAVSPHRSLIVRVVNHGRQQSADRIDISEESWVMMILVGHAHPTGFLCTQHSRD